MISDGDEEQWLGCDKGEKEKRRKLKDEMLRKGEADDARRDSLGIRGRRSLLQALSRSRPSRRARADQL